MQGNMTISRTFEDIFKHLRGKGDDRQNGVVYGSTYGSFDYGIDDNAWK